MVSTERPTRVRWVMFALACAVSWLLYLHRYSWGVIKPAFLAENPEISPTEIGWLDSAFLAAYALGQVPGGVAGDLFGPRGVLAAVDNTCEVEPVQDIETVIPAAKFQTLKKQGLV